METKNILDIGCSTGTVGRQIKEITNVHITGIEMSEDMGKEESKYLDKVIIGNVEDRILDKFKDSEFDCIILADVVEHLINPWELIKQSQRILKNNGVIIASIPNVRHFSTIFCLIIKGYWPYRERGIHDKTHLRFFTKKNIRELFENENLKKEKIIPKYRIIEKPSKINKYSKILTIFPFKSFFIFQYISIYRKT